MVAHKGQFKKGNRFAFKPGQIPHNDGVSKYNIEEEIQALNEWSNKPDSIMLVEFCDQRDIWPQRMHDWRNEYPEYAKMFVKAKMRIAIHLRKKLHDKENPYSYGLFMREIAYYDPFIDEADEMVKNREHDRKKDLIAYEMKLKSEQDQTVSQEVLEQFESTKNLLKQVRQSLEDNKDINT